MGFLRFRRTFRIGPGLRLNLSKSGVSASAGRRGLWLTIGPRGTRTTIGIPGTGLSYTEQQRFAGTSPAAVAAAPPIDEPGRLSELPTGVAASDDVPALSSGEVRLLVLLALVGLALIALVVWV
jgi:Protein of unknown function (DUF4236)